MLRITVNKSAAGAKQYYSEHNYSEGRSLDNYYTGKDQFMGVWHGKAAEQLGLNGDIVKQDFAALCDNINPSTGEKLTAQNKAERRVGYDFTFDAGKSVSLAYNFSNEDDKKQILDAFRQSVNEAMNQIEKGMQTRVRGNKQNENRDTGNLVYGEFIHFTTRPINGIPDPQLHAHCFTFNATFDKQEEKWKAGQFGQIKQDASYYEAVFHSNLAQRLQSLGYEIEKTKNGFEIAGIERGTIEKFSNRTKEIDELAEKENITSVKQKSNLGAKNRESKLTSLSADEITKDWQSRLTNTEIENFNNLKKSPLADEKKKENLDKATEAIEYSLNHHLERKSVVTEKEILSTAIRSSIGKATPEQIKQAFDKNEQIIQVKDNNQNWITTKDALTEENALITKAYQSKGTFKAINENYMPSNPQLTDEQLKAVHHALNSNDGIIIIAGKAGTGKTTLMKEVQAGIKNAGKELFAFAPSAEASRMVQRKEGFENAETIASLVQNKTQHDKLKDSVIWIDEAGMLSNKDMNKVLDIAKKQNARIILTGDIKQHSSVERGDALRTLQTEAGIQSIQVSKIQRQKFKDYKDAVYSLSKADITKGFKKLDKMGAIHEMANSTDRISAVAEDYYTSTFKNVKKGKAENEVLVVSPTHSEGEKVTEKIREKLKKEKLVAVDDRQIMIFKNMQLTAAEKEKKDSYTNDKWLIFHQNCKGFKAGSKYKVESVSDSNIIHLTDRAGKLSAVSITEASNFNVYEQKQLSIAQGDKIKITGNGKANDGRHLFNGNLYKVTGFDKQGNIKLSNGSILSKDYGHLSLGYVVTSHASQGKTVDKVIISQSSMSFKASSQEQFYVSVSRGRKGVAIYTDDKHDLLHAVNQSSQRTSAIELTQKKVLNNVIEMNRNNILKRIKDKAIEAVEKFKISVNKSMNGYELHR